MILLAEQTQFPVGQGGLHLTQVWSPNAQADHSRASDPLSVIYDCGGQGDPRRLDRCLSVVRRQIPRRNQARHVDVLVLSHLHSDHINGFKRLVGTVPVSIDRLIIPHYDDEDRLVLIAAVAASTAQSDAIVEVNDVLRDPAAWFGARGVRSVIAIAPATPDDLPPELPLPDGGPPPGYERLDTGSPDERREAERPGWAVLVRRTEAKSGTYAVVRSGAVLRLEVATVAASPHGTDWLLVPYCQRTLPKAGFAQSRASFAAAVDRILAPHRAADGGLVVHPLRAGALIADLTRAFRDYVGPRVSSSTWNVLSVSLFNGPTMPRCFLRCEAGICPRWLEIEESLIGPLSSHDRLVRLILGPRLASLMWPDISLGFVAESHAAGWMLTGDSVLTRGAPGWSAFYGHLLKSTAVFQVPHHGSRHNFDDRLDLGATTTPFVSCRPGDRYHPHVSVRAAINSKGLELLSVTTEPDTLLRAITVIRT